MKYLIITMLIFSLQLTAQSSMDKPSGALTVKETAAYQAKAESKVAELYSYLELLTDPKGDAQIKQQAASSADKLFISNTITHNVFDVKLASLPVAVLLRSAGEQEIKFSFEIKNFSIESISQTSTRKEWKMTYKLLRNGTPLIINQLFYIITEDKKFGNTTKKVTNTYLGAITIN